MKLGNMDQGNNLESSTRQKSKKMHGIKHLLKPGERKTRPSF